ncbi:ester cyclase [Marinimicrobium sp. ABcell2]|uniref:ester cyclase n=1 Tax=Marinimicrobium sp. ABcell2 TaxID=3069751 RepID=UPI0027B2DF40|nr:ester cyclase [Marinimicrobium sp. ABcell2]MDQ2076260.1 ester cyclase [Marinimicrobium sp. ABcell2]
MKKEQVRRFYEDIWNAYDKKVIPEVLHEGFTFRGSLGQQAHGYDGFAEYVDMVHGALSDYRCIIEELVSEGNKVFAKVTFTGVHQHEFMGHLPTHNQLSWLACALFTFEMDKISDVWVLGDLKGLESQLIQNRA